MAGAPPPPPPKKNVPPPPPQALAAAGCKELINNRPDQDAPLQRFPGNGGCGEKTRH